MRDLYAYFGIIGIASITAWLGAAILFLVYTWRSGRSRGWLIALGIAVVAFILGQINSARVSDIRADTSEAIDKVRARQLQMLDENARAEGQGVAAKARFAEDSINERMALSGFEETPEASTEPAYKLQGKQQRNSGMKDASVPDPAAAATAAAPATRVARTLKEADVYRANTCDRINLLFVRLILLVGIGLVGWDYLGRLNKACDLYAPIPVTGIWMDDLFPKQTVVRVCASADDRLAGFLRGMVRKGETFLYCGDKFPLNEQSLPRLQVRRRAWWRIPIRHRGESGLPETYDIFFDAAWFGRWACVFSGDGDDTGMVAGRLVAYLDMRAHTRAAAAHSVNIVWDCTPLSPSRMQALVNLCRQTNFRFIVWDRANAWADPAYDFDETVEM